MDGGFIKATGIYYRNEVNTIRKSKIQLQPVFEAFINSWEAILDRFSEEYFANGTIDIVLHKSLLLNIPYFEKLIVSDNGIGLDTDGYQRLVTLRDDSKRHSNFGTGRIQYIHYFNHTVIDSVFNDNGQPKRKKITLSKNEAFLKENAIIRLDVEDDNPDNTEQKTDVIFIEPIDDKDKEYYSSLTVKDLKEELIKHYLSLFCKHTGNMPKIHIALYEGGKLKDESNILQSDIPTPDNEKDIFVSYSKLNEKNKIVDAGHQEEFQIKAFKRPSSQIKQNAIYLVSKGATGVSLDIDILQKNDEIDGNRYMFLLSGDYLDASDRDDRGNIQLINRQDFRHQNENMLFKDEVILYDDIVETANETISKLYTELDAKNQLKNRTIDELQKMFLLNPVTVNRIRKSIKNTDNEETILKKIYQADSEIEAKKDDAIRQQILAIQSITPTKNEDYQIQLKEKVDELVTAIPLQNRTSLSKYIARRKLVLELFEQILNGELESLKGGKRIDEKLLHNLLFQQSSTSENPEDSDLWLINEEFIYFKGVSEFEFKDIEYDGKKIFDKELTEEDKRYLDSLGEKRLTKRPDVLLFPSENKAIIIEFKAPDVNVSEHLSQIDLYANLLLNYTRDDLHLNTFYGYLIGENIEDRDVRGRVSRFEHSPNFDYWFRPSEKVNNFNGGQDGNIYTEVIKYSTLLQRAKLRNKIFIEKLEKGEGK